MSLIIHQNRRPRVHRTAYVAPGAVVLGDVELGDGASVWFQCVLRGDINAIRVGDRSNIQDGSILHVTHELPAVVGNDVTVGHRAIIHGCVVENECLIGMGAVLLDNVRIGKGSLVAAGSVVKENATIPGGMLVAGIPARVVRELRESEKESIRQSALRYVEYAAAHRSNQVVAT